MHAETTLTGTLTFETKIRDHVFYMDTQVAAGGENKGPSPKELMLAGIIGCTGMDVVTLLKKHKPEPFKISIKADAEPRSSHPRIFTGVDLLFEVEGKDITAEMLTDAARLSLTKFCGVSAMVTKVVPIRYRLILNSKVIGHGEANFDI